MFRRRHSHMRPICCPPHVMPTQVAPAQISPTQEVVRTNIFNTIVPHIHPVHTTTVNRHVFHHQHYYPQTYSQVNEYYQTSRQCGDPRNPNPNCFPIPRRFGF
ncbi:CotD family spore coat protein [Ureibacillus sp. FSL K6-8385]|uniref:CotD family spore coat protein n=1 Tax=Ureibacillus sp. FSL K6-8385 TaxID=2954684 RepID=UPI00315993DB